MSSEKLHIIYVSGLGDRYDTFRSKYLEKWNGKMGAAVTFVPMKWLNQHETMDEKLKRIEAAIESHPSARTVLVGESAGGSVVIAASELLSGIDKVITLCGKNVRANRVSPYLYEKNPAFRPMMSNADDAATKRSHSSIPVTTFKSFGDHVVRPIDMHVEGSVMKQLPTFGHFFAIGSVLVVLWPLIVREAKRS